MALLLLRKRHAVAGRRAARVRSAAGACALAAVLFAPLVPADAGEATDGSWRRLGPPQLAASPDWVFHDPVRRRILLFEAQTDGLVLWQISTETFDGWTSLGRVPDGPGNYYFNHRIYDADGNRFLTLRMQGNNFDDGIPARAVSVWSFDLDGMVGWDSLAVEGIPPLARHSAAVTYDRASRRLFLVGGEPYPYAGMLGDAWQLALEPTPTWSEIVPAGPGLIGTAGAKARYDALHDRLLVSGGIDSVRSFQFEFIRSWALDLGGDRAWRPLATADTLWNISTLSDHLLDPETGELRVLRPSQGTWEPPDSSFFWVLNPAGTGDWRRQSFGGTDRIIAGADLALFDDPENQRILAVGGRGSNREGQGFTRCDVWSTPSTAGGNWTRHHASLSGGGWATYVPLVHDAERGDLWEFFTRGGGGPPTQYPLEGPATAVEIPTTASAPQRRFAAAAIFDSQRNRAILFGGLINQDLELGDLWEVDFAFRPARWRRLATAGDPPVARYGATAVYDRARRRMILFGGYAGRALDDLWELDVTERDPAWRRIEPVGPRPAARFWHSAVYDSRRDGMVVHGGATGTTINTGAHSDSWFLSFADGDSWSPISRGVHGSTPRYGHSAVYDPVEDRMVVFWGRDVAGARSDIRALRFSPAAEWSELVPGAAGPQPRYLASAFYDAPRDRIVLVGGSASFRGPDFDDRWSIDFERDTTPPPYPADGPAFRLLAIGPNPSRGDVTVHFEMPRPASVSLRIHDVRGRVVRRYPPTALPSGPHVYRWDGRADSGARLADGVYFARLEVEGEVVTGKLVLMD